MVLNALKAEVIQQQPGTSLSSHSRFLFVRRAGSDGLKVTAPLTANRIKSPSDYASTNFPFSTSVRPIFFFFLKQCLVQRMLWHPTCLPTPTTNRQRRCYILWPRCRSLRLRTMFLCWWACQRVHIK